MKLLGTLLLLAGLATIILKLMNKEVEFLGWIDQWGVTVGWIIRAAIVVLGLVLLMAGRRRVHA